LISFFLQDCPSSSYSEPGCPTASGDSPNPNQHHNAVIPVTTIHAICATTTAAHSTSRLVLCLELSDYWSDLGISQQRLCSRHGKYDGSSSSRRACCARNTNTSESRRHLLIWAAVGMNDEIALRSTYPKIYLWRISSDEEVYQGKYMLGGFHCYIFVPGF
jgi:hypothetical protein